MEEMRSDEWKEAFLEAIKHLFDSLPQPDHATKVSALIMGVYEASGLDKDKFTQAMAAFGTVLHQSYVEVVVHHHDGSKQSFVEPDFHYDVRPGSPYYTPSNSEQGNMEPLDSAEKVVQSLNAALVLTLRKIEAAQPEAGFSSLFMDLLKKNLEGVIAGDAIRGLDTRQPLMGIHRDILRMFMAKDLGDVLDEHT